MTLAKYIRLSDADEDVGKDKAESNSVINQRRLLDEYIERSEALRHQKVLEFLDDGRSGTNFERPGFQALMEHVKIGEVHTVIVKDFSRLGRNYLEVGSLLEYTFPLLGVRFISANDGYDSKNHKYGTAGDFDTAARNLINELYSKDISQKVKASRRQYAERGECISAYPIYGYVKSKENRRMLVPDPPAAHTVRLVFELCIAGKSNSEIAQTLNEKGVSTPSGRKRELGAKRDNWNSFRSKNEWSAQNVLRILREERYTGKLIACKMSRSELGKLKSSKVLPESQWIVVDNAFEAIISQETFEAAQSKTQFSKLSRPFVENQNLFVRKLKCGCCALAPELVNNQNRRYYKCGMKAWNSDQGCQNVCIDEDALIQSVLSSIRHQAQLAVRIQNRLQAAENQRHKAAQVIPERLRRLRMRADKYTSEKKEVFFSYNRGNITHQEFTKKSLAFSRKIAELNEEIKQLEQSEEQETSVPAVTSVSYISTLTNLRMLERETVEKLIRRIWIYDAQTIEIDWNFTAPY